MNWLDRSLILPKPSLRGIIFSVTASLKMFALKILIFALCLNPCCKSSQTCRAAHAGNYRLRFRVKSTEILLYSSLVYNTELENKFSNSEILFLGDTALS